MGSLSSVPTSIPRRRSNAPGQKQRFELGWLVGPQHVFAFERRPIKRFAQDQRQQQSEQRQSKQRQQPQRRQRDQPVSLHPFLRHALGTFRRVARRTVRELGSESGRGRR
jgi:hypothetical protein